MSRFRRIDASSRIRRVLVLPLVVLSVLVAVPATASANGGDEGRTRGCGGGSGGAVGCTAPVTITGAKLLMNIMGEQWIDVTGTVRCETAGTVFFEVNANDEVTADTFHGGGSVKCVTPGECIGWLATAFALPPPSGARPGDTVFVEAFATNALVATASRTLILQQV
jgi:hypothetical protein